MLLAVLFLPSPTPKLPEFTRDPNLNLLLFSFLPHRYTLCHQLRACMYITLNLHQKYRSLSGFLGQYASLVLLCSWIWSAASFFSLKPEPKNPPTCVFPSLSLTNPTGLRLPVILSPKYLSRVFFHLYQALLISLLNGLNLSAFFTDLQSYQLPILNLLAAFHPDVSSEGPKTSFLINIFSIILHPIHCSHTKPFAWFWIPHTLSPSCYYNISRFSTPSICLFSSY